MAQSMVRVVPEGSRPASGRRLLPGAGIPADAYVNLGAWPPGAAGGVPVAWIGGGSFTSGRGSLPEAARHGRVTIKDVGLRVAVGGYAASRAVST